MTIVQILSASIMIPAFIGAANYYSLPSYGRMFVWFMWIGVLTEVVSIAVKEVVGNNMIVYYLYCAATALFLGIAYSKIIGKNLKIFYLVPVVAVIESVLSGYQMFNSYSFTILNLLIIGAVLTSYHKMIFGEIGDDIFFFNGVLIFGAMSELIFFFTAVFLQKYDMSLMRLMFGVHCWTNMVTNLAFGYSLWKLSKSYSSAQ